MVYVVYRVLYGEDFIQDSIKSIINHVDKVFVFWTDKVWGGATSCVYRGKTIAFPSQIDNVLDKIKELKEDKIVLEYDHVNDNVGQFTHLVNNKILPNHDKPDIVIFIEPDHVFRQDQIVGAIKEFKQSAQMCMGTGQIELWKEFKYRVPERPGRLSVVFWNLTNIDKVPPTSRHANIKNMKFLRSYVHNLGFCLNQDVMYWKHMLALGFSQRINEALPNENWYTDKWLLWDFKTNNRNLEISKGREHMIPYALEYDVSGLPEILKDELIT